MTACTAATRQRTFPQTCKINDRVFALLNGVDDSPFVITKLTKNCKTVSDLLTLPLPISPYESTSWCRLYGSSLALATVEAAKSHDAGPVVLVVDDLAHAHQLNAEITFYSSEQHPILHLPDWETLPYDVFSPLQDIISERLKTLHALPRIRSGTILILPVNALLQKLTPRDYIEQNVLMLRIGDTLDIEPFRRQLEASGYANVSQVMEHGEFAVRGSIVDLYPAGSHLPYRIDLFDDEIESIRSFNPSDQRTLEKTDRIELLPAREFPTDKEAIRQFRERYRERIAGDPLISQIYNNVSDGLIPAGIEYYLPLYFDQMDCVFDYLPKNTLFVLPQQLDADIDDIWQNLAERFEQRRHDVERPILPPETLFLQADEVNRRLNPLMKVVTSVHKSTVASNNLEIASPPELLLQTQAQQPAKNFVDYLNSYPGRLLLVAETAGRREALNDLLRDHHLHAHPCANWQDFLHSAEQLCITVAEIGHGLLLQHPAISVITEPQIFGQRVSQQRRRKRATLDSDAVIRNLTDLHTGSPVVHIDYGIGRYLGLQQLDGSNAMQAEYLTIEYAGGDKLYVPVTSLHLISRYTGASEETAPLHRLGSDQWQRAKKKAAQKAADVAAELLDVHARRAATSGHSYDIGQDEYAGFVSAFPFEETPDQENAISNVIDDLSTPQPMDRVVCGDVGFGKTEVAMRAAFIVANSGKQVAILVPTTLLAQQHYQNFKDRFADWPIHVECLSRFNTKKRQDDIIAQLKSGKLDIVIGTHKLLQRGIEFDNLGLIIVDEEHRFGVRHKEKLKSMRAEVDILTLTATPIPRTLNMSLAGVRDLSIIATPPLQRHSINTFITEWNDALITEACLREIKRGGQIYFLHNEVKTIEKIADDVRALVPVARVEVAHGQMPEKRLEQVMLDFYHQRFNILVCTTIIESGIDVPTANTIIINRADKLGLAQLHQIRGRVGRSHHRAYAYMVAPPVSALTQDAKKRLDAIESLEDLGVGFTLATHDLEIRGAGELLGENQSGQISEIGFSLYTEILEKAVNALKAGEIPNPDAPLDAGIEIDLGIPAVIPDDYVYDVHLRLILYKRIASAKSSIELDELKVEFIDRFGLLPDATRNLFEITELRLLAEQIGLEKIDANDSGARLLFSEKPNINPAKLIELIQTSPKLYRFNGADVLNFTKELQQDATRIQEITDVLHTLSEQKAA
ncbi:MAG: transcription-repair coupling factor [Gammaproteobacteria bacterium]|nr:transcription-repair coupling factor [Gammaproteobacteria bacterium]